MKKNTLLLSLLFFIGVSCSPAASFSEITPPTEIPQQTDTPIPITSSPTVEPTIQETYSATITPTASLGIEEETVKPTDPLPSPFTITIVYDNHPFDERLKTAWGFAALVEYQDHTLLFDTGGVGLTLMENMRVLGIDPGKIETVVLSHAHGDHTGGLNALLEYGAQPVVYIPPSFPVSFKKQVSKRTEVIEVAPGQMIA